MKLSSRHITILLFFLFFHTLASAQSGSYYLTHYTGHTWEQERNWSIVQDHQNNLILANRTGLTIFSGNENNHIETPAMPFVLEYDSSTQKVYVGCRNNLGYLQKDKKGFYRYQSLLGDSVRGDFTHIFTDDSIMYFMSDREIYRMDRMDQSMQRKWTAQKGHPFTGMLKNSQNVFINVWNKGLHRLQSDTLFPIVSGYWTKKDQLLFHIRYDENRILLGTDDNELYLFDGMKFYNYRPEHNQYIKESTVTGALNISDSVMALSTLAGGVVVIDKKNDKTIQIINYLTGLPEDEVYAMGMDKNRGLWISHSYGLTRAALNLPVKNFATYPGLKGRALHSIQADSTLYVATTDGVYYLAKTKNYSEKEVTIKHRKPIDKEEAEKKEKAKQEKKNPTSFFKRIANKLFNSNEKEKKAEEKSVEESAQRQEYIYRKKKIYDLESISYEYRKIPGITGKYNQLTLFHEGVCIATNNGLYYVKPEQKSIQITDPVNIHQIFCTPDLSTAYLATDQGIKKVDQTGDTWEISNPAPSINSGIYSVALSDSNTLWAGGQDLLYRIDMQSQKNPTIQTYKLETRYPEQYKVSTQNDSIYLLLNQGIYKFHTAQNSFRPVNSYITSNSQYSSLDYDDSQQNVLWVEKDQKWIPFSKHIKDDSTLLQKYLKLFESVEDIYYQPPGAWVTTEKGIFRINLQEGTPSDRNFKAYFSNIRENGKSDLEIHNFNFKEENAALEFRVSAPHFIGKNDTEYQFYVKGMMDDWSEWRKSPSIQLFTQKGSYTIKARARNIWGDIQETQTLQFNIPPPFTQTIWFYGIVTLGGIFLLFLIIKIREKKLQRDKRILEEKVQERTKTIENQKEEIKIQRDDIAEKRDNLQRQHKEITDSIEYASRIQSALLPLVKHFHTAFSDHLVLFKPRDVVSGDFYWITRQNNKVYVTAADCTGHGVPGAFMSMLGISFLNEIVHEKAKEKECNAADILDELREMVKDSLHQTNDGDNKSKDGMDMALCVVDYEHNKLHYAGAHNPLWRFRGEQEPKEIKADRMPIGIYLKKEEKPFTNHVMDFQPGDTFYMFSDGYPDQFGGPRDKKFKKKNLKQLLGDIYDRDMEEQYRLLEHNFEEWKGDNIQTDDVILIGFRI